MRVPSHPPLPSAEMPDASNHLCLKNNHPLFQPISLLSCAWVCAPYVSTCVSARAGGLFLRFRYFFSSFLPSARCCVMVLIAVRRWKSKTDLFGLIAERSGILRARVSFNTEAFWGAGFHVFIPFLQHPVLMVA